MQGNKGCMKILILSSAYSDVEAPASPAVQRDTDKGTEPNLKILRENYRTICKRKSKIGSCINKWIKVFNKLFGVHESGILIRGHVQEAESGSEVQRSLPDNNMEHFIYSIIHRIFNIIEHRIEAAASEGN